MPHLVEMAKEYSADDLVILGVETTNRPEMAREYVESVGADWPHLLDDQDVAGRLFALRGVPTSLFIDPQGRILFRMVGFREGDERIIRDTITALVERKKLSS